MRTISIQKSACVCRIATIWKSHYFIWTSPTLFSYGFLSEFSRSGLDSKECNFIFAKQKLQANYETAVIFKLFSQSQIVIISWLLWNFSFKVGYPMRESKLVRQSKINRRICFLMATLLSLTHFFIFHSDWTISNKWIVFNSLPAIWPKGYQHGSLGKSHLGFRAGSL